MTRSFGWSTSIIALALLAACADTPPEAPPELGHTHDDLPDEATESRPLPEDGTAFKRGGLDCTPLKTTGYDAGRPFEITVVQVDGKPVQTDTAAAYLQMRDHAEREGVYLQIVSGFRSMAQQEYLYSCYVNCACNNCNLAAYPGYSNHQSGYALDLNTEAPGVYRWLSRNASSYGFQRTVPSEDWHWEYFGARRTLDCAQQATPISPNASLRFSDLRPNASYTNGLWLKVQADPSIHLVRYSAEGVPLGSSEDRRDNFSAHYTFRNLGPHTILAQGFNDRDQLIAQAHVPLSITPGAQRSASLQFSSLEDGAWYRNGQWLKVDASPSIAQVRYFAGGYNLGDGNPQSPDFELRLTLHTLGYRSLLAVGYDPQGRELARHSLVARFLPGQDPQPQVVPLSPAPNTSSPKSTTFKAIASHNVVAVEYFADQFLLGRSQDPTQNFPLPYTFSQSGPRNIKIIAYDAQNSPLTSTQFTLHVLP